jgi:hypothetical protein
VKRASTVVFWLALGGCGPATTGAGDPRATAPEPGPTTTPVGVPEPTGVIYRPVRNAAYTLVRHDSLSLQLPGGASQEQLIDRTAYLDVTLVPDTGGYQVIIVLDSLQASAGGVPAALDSLIPAWGTRWTGTLTPEGDLSALTADRSTTFGDQVGGTLRSLFPALPPGGVRVGMEWTDTTDVPVRADAFDASEQGITQYRAVESDDRSARRAIRLESRGSYERTGKGMQFDQQLEMSGAGTRTAVYLLAPDGFLLSGRGSDSGNMTITVPAVGQTVPVKQTGSYTLSRVDQPGNES